MKKGQKSYVVISPELRIVKKPVANFNDAATEAKSLASDNQECTFYIAELTWKVRSKPVEIEFTELD